MLLLKFNAYKRNKMRNRLNGCLFRIFSFIEVMQWDRLRLKRGDWGKKNGNIINEKKNKKQKGQTEK